MANFTLSSLIIYISSPDSKLLNVSSPGCLEFEIARNLHNRAKSIFILHYQALEFNEIELQFEGERRPVNVNNVSQLLQ